MNKQLILACAAAYGFMQQADASSASAGTIGAGTEDLDSTTLLDLDNIDDLDFGSIEKAPGFVQPPDGIYILSVDKACVESYQTKGTSDKPAATKRRFAHYYSIVSVVELANASEQKPNVGDKFSERFMLNAEGKKYWASKAEDIIGKENIGAGVKVPEILQTLTTGGYQFKARVVNKKTPEKNPDGTLKTGGREFTNTNVRVMARIGDEDKAKVNKNPTEANI